MRGSPGSTALPVIFLENECGEVVVHGDALVYAQASLAAYRPASIERDVETIARLYDFFRVFWHGNSLPEDDVDYLIYAYLLWRHSGTLTGEGSSRLGGLRWRPLAAEGLRAEFASINRYFRFCSQKWGYVALGRMRRDVRRDGPPLNRMRETAGMKERDFFVHLSASREYWASHFGSEVEMPPVVTRPARSAEASLTQIMPEEEVWQIIGRERNPVYRALWLVGGFGGLRISEQLNAWQCDVLPASTRQLLFGYEGSDILFLRADPMRSRYVGELGKSKETREQHLLAGYRMQPRCVLNRKHPLYAGWKGTLYLQRELLLNEVFWLNPRAAALFAECASEIREFHRLHQTSKHHPWFYVNIADPTGDHRGSPLKISNVEAAWERACRRCDLQPHSWGRKIHGLRHFYKALGKSMGFGPDQIQIMMGHRSIESQDNYGRSAIEISRQLANIRTTSSRIVQEA
jgi:hypothetical protein